MDCREAYKVSYYSRIARLEVLRRGAPDCGATRRAGQTRHSSLESEPSSICGSRRAAKDCQRQSGIENGARKTAKFDQSSTKVPSCDRRSSLNGYCSEPPLVQQERRIPLSYS